MAITLTPAAFQSTLWSVYNGVYNRRDPYKVDRKQYPLLSMMMRQTEAAPLAGADGVIIKYKTQSNLDIQGWERKDRLLFAEQEFELETVFPWSNVHQGAEIVHDDIEAKGFIVTPNAPRGKNFAKPDSKSDAYKMIDYMKEWNEAQLDKNDVNYDLLLHRNNSYNPKLPQGLDAYWPIVTTPSMVSDADGTRGYVDVGSVGGKDRAAFPEVLQHYVWANATFGPGGSLRTALNTAIREARLRSRGRSGGGIKVILAGARALDKYVKFGRDNNTNIESAYTQFSPAGTAKLDLGIPDSALHFNGIPIVHDPTFEALDAIENPAIPWTDRMYLIDPSCFCLSFAPGKKNIMTFPADEPDVRLTRSSIDSKMVMLPKVQNAMAVVSLAQA